MTLFYFRFIEMKDGNIEIQETIVLHIEDETGTYSTQKVLIESKESEKVELKPKQDKVPNFKKRDRVKCQECNMLVTWNYLATHMYEMHYYLPDVISPSVLCSKCGVICKDNRTYALHSRTHDHSCDICPTTFSSEQDLTKHKAFHFQKEHQCDKCEQSFDDLYEYILHKETHDGLGKYTCTRCSFSTSKQDSIKNHLKRHDRPIYQCGVCEKKFFGQSVYNAHMEIHSGVKKYSCEYCPKKFLTANYLKMHRDLNHQKELYGYEMTYPCPECGRTFTFEKSLKRHLSSMHKIGEDRTVLCPVCSKTIANNYNLKVHMRQHTGETTNMCDTCGLAYSTYKSLKKHVLKHHPGVKLEPKTEPKTLKRVKSEVN